MQCTNMKYSRKDTAVDESFNSQKQYYVTVAILAVYLKCASSTDKQN